MITPKRESITSFHAALIKSALKNNEVFPATCMGRGCHYVAEAFGNELMVMILLLQTQNVKTFFLILLKKRKVAGIQDKECANIFCKKYCL